MDIFNPFISELMMDIEKMTIKQWGYGRYASGIPASYLYRTKKS